MIRIPCNECGKTARIESRSDRECDHCGEQIPKAAIDNYVARAERTGVPYEPTERN